MICFKFDKEVHAITVQQERKNQGVLHHSARPLGFYSG